MLRIPLAHMSLELLLILATRCKLASSACCVRLVGIAVTVVGVVAVAAAELHNFYFLLLSMGSLRRHLWSLQLHTHLKVCCIFSLNIRAVRRPGRLRRWTEVSTAFLLVTNIEFVACINANSFGCKRACVPACNRVCVWVNDATNTPPEYIISTKESKKLQAE